MKKTLIAALALIVAGASFTTAEAAKKKKKEAVKAAVVVPAPVSLVSGSDSLSYIAGMTFTEGLLPYL